MRVVFFAAVLSAHYAAAYEVVQCASSCASDLDCSLNGICNTSSGQCQCDAAWTGPCCSALNFLPVDIAKRGYMANRTSTWGANIIKDDSSGSPTYHMWCAEMAPATAEGVGSCGLTTWASNSQITHLTSSDPLGPYQRQEVAVPIWSHNPLVRLINGTYVLYHIGSGSGAAPADGYCAQNGTSPCGEQSFDLCESPCASTPSVPGYSCVDGYCSGDGAADGDCGSDLAEPQLDCNDYASCAKAAAEACSNTTGCVSFGLCELWGFGKAKLFSAGKGGLTPNPQWTMWVQNGHGHSEDMYARRRKRIAADGTIATGSGSARAVAPDGSCMLELHTANSTAGPWTPYTQAVISPCGGNNPAPWLHPNGTVYLVVTDNDMGLYSAPSWQGPYNLVVSGACGGGEDPSLYVDKRGHFHCLFHQSPFSVPDIAIGHAFSLDGLTWTVSDYPAANSTIMYSGLPNTTGPVPVIHGKRERPHLYFDDNGDIAAFVSGVCITPRCNPIEGTIDPSADCNSTTQYHQCDANSPGPGWFDRTYTLVQGVVTP
jgi:hypothetical protein